MSPLDIDPWLSLSTVPVHILYNCTTSWHEGVRADLWESSLPWLVYLNVVSSGSNVS